METTKKDARLRVVVLKADRLYGDMIRRQIVDLWPGAEVEVFQRGFDALQSIQSAEPDLFITGVMLDDMDGLEHIEAFLESQLPILIVTSRADPRTFCMLRELRYDGIYDAATEGGENLPAAIEQVSQRRPYVSPSIWPQLKQPKKLTLDTLTAREQEVLAAIGDGSDDSEAAARLGMSPNTVGTHRKAIMRKLKIHHRGQLTQYASQFGYIRYTPTAVYRPGFQRRLRGGPNSSPP